MWPVSTQHLTAKPRLILLLAGIAMYLAPAASALPQQGLLLDLDAREGVVAQADGLVTRWTSTTDLATLHFDATRPNGGEPRLMTQEPAIDAPTVLFARQELINDDEDIFDPLTTGAGHTWLAVIAPGEQVSRLKDVNSFFGNLKNGRIFEGLWAGLADDNRLWAGARNGLSFGRWDRNNPRLLGQQLEAGRYYVLAGRLSAGHGEQTLELFVNNGSAPVATLPFPVNPDADPSRMAIGQERDAVEHPGRESFDGSIARMMIYNRPLSDDELRQAVTEFQTMYAIDTDDGWEPLFDGQTLEGWRVLPDADVPAWRVEDGTIVGGNGQTAVSKNTFLCTEQTIGDFEFRCQFKIEGDPETGLINSGIQYRSYLRRHFVTGYQADIGAPDWWGGIYDERRRGRLVPSDMESLTPALYPDGWNNYLIRCVGNHHQLFINGILTAEHTETDADIPAEGFFGFQLHSGGVATVRFRDIYIRQLETE